MLRTVHKTQFLEHVSSELAFRQHPTHSFVKEEVRLLGDNIDTGADFLTTRVTTVALVFFASHFAREARVVRVGFVSTRETHQMSVQNDDVVARINVRRVRRLVLAHKHGCQFCGKTADDLIRGINDVPVVLDGFVSFEGRGHRSIFRSFRPENRPKVGRSRNILGRCFGELAAAAISDRARIPALRAEKRRRLAASAGQDKRVYEREPDQSFLCYREKSHVANVLIDSGR